MAKIAVVGSLNMDLVAVTPRIPVAGETITGGKFFTAPGGKGANQAYAAAKLGGQTAMLGRVGADDFGQAMRNNLAGVGCDVTGVRTTEGPSGVALIFVAESSGANSIVVAPGANHKLTAGDIPTDGAVFDGCSVLLLQLETPIETVTAAAHYAKQRGARVILDPAPAPSGGLPEELLKAVDILTRRMRAKQRYWQDWRRRPLTPDEAGAIARTLQAKGTATIIVKLGEQGCLAGAGREAAVRFLRRR